MNKSTPISQLPSQAAAQNTFVSEQQKQMITQAQNAVQNMTLPQNTQSTDILNDDDATIQEVLNQVGSISSPPLMEAMSMPIPPQQQQMPPMMNQMQMQQQMQQQMQGGIDPMLFNSMMSSQMQQPQPSMGMGRNIEQFVSAFADDIKLASLVFIVYVAVNFAPIDKVIGRYIALDKIPYHDVLLKALVATVVVVFVKKVLTK